MANNEPAFPKNHFGEAAEVVDAPRKAKLLTVIANGQPVTVDSDEFIANEVKGVKKTLDQNR